MSKDEDKKPSFDEIMKSIRKDFGDGAVCTLGDKAFDPDIEVIPTGSLSLDAALGVLGLPKGRIIEIIGPESSGKTTLALHVLANAKGRCAYVDAEHAFDMRYAKKLGVRVDELILSQPKCAEEGLEIAERLISSGEVEVIVIDSVAALTPRSELDGEMGEAQMGVQARLMSQAMRKLTGLVAKNKCLVIFINQIRMKIGVMWGSPETTSGGNALKFYASVRLDIRRISNIKQGEEAIGSHTRVKVIKNKVAPPFRECEFDILYGIGIDRISEVCDLCVEHGLIEKSGSWYSINGTRLQGKDAIKEWMMNNPDQLPILTELLRQKLHT